MQLKSKQQYLTKTFPNERGLIGIPKIAVRKL